MRTILSQRKNAAEIKVLSARKSVRPKTTEASAFAPASEIRKFGKGEELCLRTTS